MDLFQRSLPMPSAWLPSEHLPHAWLPPYPGSNTEHHKSNPRALLGGTGAQQGMVRKRLGPLAPEHSHPIQWAHSVHPILTAPNHSPVQTVMVPPSLPCLKPVLLEEESMVHKAVRASLRGAASRRHSADRLPIALSVGICPTATETLMGVCIPPCSPHHGKPPLEMGSEPLHQDPQELFPQCLQEPCWGA